MLAHARAMRREPTPAERLLWRALRDRTVGGAKFRHQQVIGPYIVDFYCPAARLVVEVDGATHADSPTDPARDAWLATQGIAVLRVWNNEVMGNPEGVLQAIGEAVAARVASGAATLPLNLLLQSDGETS